LEHRAWRDGALAQARAPLDHARSGDEGCAASDEW